MAGPTSDPAARVRGFFERSDQGHIDLPRAREGGFGGGLFSVFVGADPQAWLTGWASSTSALAPTSTERSSRTRGG
jgi:hypothetical protein